jgi:hypothetical protein
MIHIAVGFMVVSFTLLALSFVSLLDTDARSVGGLFIFGSFIAVAASTALFLYVRREGL